MQFGTGNDIRTKMVIQGNLRKPYLNLINLCYSLLRYINRNLNKWGKNVAENSGGYNPTYFLTGNIDRLSFYITLTRCVRLCRRAVEKVRLKLSIGLWRPFSSSTTFFRNEVTIR